MVSYMYGSLFKSQVQHIAFSIRLIDVIFHLQKSLEIFDKQSVDKIWSKKNKGWKMPSLMTIRGNTFLK